MTQLSTFYVPWAAAMVVAGAQPAVPAPDAVTILHFEGMSFPVVQSVLAIAGVLMARPLARKKESTLPLSHFVIVTTILMVAALAWVAQSRPGVLFTFVVAIGLGFSGYALVETVGNEIQDFVKRVAAQAASVLPSIGVKK